MGFATQAGGTTIDQDRYGGNPFATALIEASLQDNLQLRNLRSRVTTLTVRKSHRVQHPQWQGSVPRGTWYWNAGPGSNCERREALVLVVSDYSARKAAASLDGAAIDERRIAAMLATCGFSVTQGVGPRQKDLVGALRRFKERSKRCDAAVLYSTGHGIEVDEQVFLLPGDYPFSRGFSLRLLTQRAVPVGGMEQAMRARRVNLVLFAGCRTFPTA